MEPNNQENIENTNGTQKNPETNDKKGNGALVGAIIVVILIIIGGVYLLTNQIKETPYTEDEIENIQIQETTSNEDLSASVINSLNAIEEELQNIETQITIENIE